MYEKFDRHASNLKSTKGCTTFSQQWDIEVANQHKDKFTDPKTVPTFRKSAGQLQKHYDKLEKKNAQTTLVRQTNPQKERMDGTLRETQIAMPTTQAAANCEPAIYANAGGRASFGAPTALSSHIAAAAFQHANPIMPQLARVLFKAKKTHKTPAAVANMLGQNFKTNACCWRCGFSKKSHSQLCVAFG